MDWLVREVCMKEASLFLKPFILENNFIDKELKMRKTVKVFSCILTYICIE